MTLTNDIGGLAGAWKDRRQGRNTLRREDRTMLARYLRLMGYCAMVGWVLAGAYLVLTPVKYLSRWTLILPGSAQSATMSVDSIGQATSSATSPFGSVSLSPKVVYKEIADSDGVRAAAAQASGITFESFGRPRIKLIDETGLMQFEIGGATAELAIKKAQASIEALNRQLDTLRQDELEKRATATTLNLKSYKDAVEKVRRKITDTQLSSGLLSVAQFNESVANLGTTRRRLTDMTAEYGRLYQEQAQLIARVGIDSTYASLALRMAADPAVVKLVGEYADSNGSYEIESKRLGPANPNLIQIQKRRNASRDQLRKLVSKLDLGSEAEGRTMILLTNISHQAELFQQMVRNEATITGKAKEIEALTTEKNRLEEEIKRLSGAAAQLEDLKKEHSLAEAVYSSAVARIDTSKSDIYGAYPIVQVLAAPSLPVTSDQPRRSYALGGGLAASLFSVIAWSLAWLRYLQMTKRRKKPSSPGSSSAHG
jgi:uncharacterized protein involved in exopolysaccharide biosynthesis